MIWVARYETRLFAKSGGRTDLPTQYTARHPSGDPVALLPPIAHALSSKNGDLYAVPFYGESSMMFYNKALFAAAGLTMPQHPTWAQIQTFAAKLNQPGKQSGICLRGLAGWGDNMAPLATLATTFRRASFDIT